MEIHIHGLSKKLLILFLITTILNLLALDVWILVVNNKNTLKKTGSKVTDTTPITTSCPQSCLIQIHQATAAVVTTPTTATTNTTTSSSSQAQEIYITIGSGTNSTDDWEDISGLQVYVDSTKYGRINSVLFEASVHIPTLNEWANVRLFNVTDKHPVWFSEVFFPGGSPATLLVSQPITLDQGNKLYKVQMKTQLKYQAFLDQSRIHITTY